ncbi:succinate dehydrogenase, hydrophobic membrane anchor protein [Agrobacterium sp. SORGH_AS 787]|uniref:succinate dehydrogenase, hydrophobic membrane anchor protein n=1 Tax=Agrobacterium sp. SORGH_AS 787 TaxID=3041775 RepID=UPI002789A885|nr:succinate dehydrogenase / fumarate reductase membrane anchor subunit [Rhizobium sp. SORGH_AS_0787]
MTTHLKRVQGLGSAKGGTVNYALKQVTGFAAALVTPYMIFLGIWLFGKPRPVVLEAFTQWWVAAPTLIFIFLSVWHMRIGMHAIIDDYVHGHFLKLVLVCLNWMFAWGVGLLCGLAVIRMFLA